MRYLIHILLLAGMCSCSMPKAVTEKRQTYRIDSLVTEKKDSVVLHHLSRATLQSVVNLTHYRLSPPDSSGRQYVQTVTRGEISQTEKQSVLIQESKNSRESTRQLSRREAHEEVSLRPIRPVGKWVIYGLLLLGFIFIVGKCFWYMRI